MPSLDLAPRVAALLGPTNTGKTWRARARMLGHRTGMMGLPLRLLAREVYDQVSAEVGEAATALVTGEEKRIPPSPRYWICTTESMPLERPVDFLAVDEVQLCEHRERGHVFTDRLLRARGFRETWFLGSDSAASLLQELVPTVTLDSSPRRSKLTYTGMRSLQQLPRRTAIIAFSMSEVYRLAEALRRRYGGAAVVMGALSPRTRNAQVAMFQSGEVDYIVATDAIGMGLNLDIDHVAFASLAKFDGQTQRPLTASELAQIAGRAGRNRRDGTFGTLTEAGELSPDLVEAIEHSRLPPLTRAYWRNPDLDYSGVDALIASLRRTPPSRRYRPVPRSEDLDTLLTLAARPEVRARATTPERVALLWELCRLPDHLQTLTDHHANLVATLYEQLVRPNGLIAPDWMSAQVAPLDQVSGDLDTLLTRLAGVRTWTTVAFHGAWLGDAAGWQARTRAVEDRLSDALHERLIWRFVDRRTLALGKQPTLEVAPDGGVGASDLALGQLRGLCYESATPGDKQGLRAARAGLQGELDRRDEALVQAEHAAITLHDDGTLAWAGGRLGRWVAGEDWRSPQVRLDDLPLVGPGARTRVHRRLVAWSRAAVARLTEGRGVAEGLRPPARGVHWAVTQGLGVAPREAVAEQLDALSPGDRHALARLDLRLGQAFLYVPALLQPEATRLRGLLWAAWSGRAALPVPTGPAGRAAGDPESWRALGYVLVGPAALRVDLFEQVLASLRRAARVGAPPPLELIAGWMGLGEAEARAVIERLAPRGR